jgi:quinol monooxygenase YgiN
VTFAKQLVMQAAAGRSSVLESALRVVADAIRTLPGCVGVDVMRDVDREGRFILVEKWVSSDAQKAAVGSLPAEILTPVRDSFDHPPESIYLDFVHIA